MTDPVFDITNVINAGTGPLDWLRKTSDGGDGTLFMLDMPPTPDSACAVRRYQGRQPTETFGNPLSVRHPRLQIEVRDPSSRVALNRAEEILRHLVVIKNEVINGTLYQRVKPVGEPFELGPDESKRQRAIVNFEVSYNDSI